MHPSQELNRGDLSLRVFTFDTGFKDIERGRGPRKNELKNYGTTPFITSTDSNNGLIGFTDDEPIHSGNVLTVARNGSVAESFFQSKPFCSTEDVHVFNPKFELNKYIALFLTTLIRKERYRYNYGRKWGLKRMNESIILLPSNEDGEPDWAFMEDYIKRVRYTKNL